MSKIFNLRNSCKDTHQKNMAFKDYFEIPLLDFFLLIFNLTVSDYLISVKSRYRMKRMWESLHWSKVDQTVPPQRAPQHMQSALKSILLHETNKTTIKLSRVFFFLKWCTYKTLFVKWGSFQLIWGSDIFWRRRVC